MAQVFEKLARERHWYPIVVSTLRKSELELETVDTLISYRIEYLVVTGATDPDSISRVCKTHGIAHVNVDLPGSAATSVVSDNYWGAQQLTRALIKQSRPVGSAARDKIYFVGGLASDHATQRRMKGFSEVIAQQFGRVSAGQIDACGYEGELAEAAVRRLYERWADCRARSSSIRRSRSKAWFASSTPCRRPNCRDARSAVTTGIPLRKC